MAEAWHIIYMGLSLAAFVFACGAVRAAFGAHKAAKQFAGSVNALCAPPECSDLSDAEQHAHTEGLRRLEHAFQIQAEWATASEAERGRVIDRLGGRPGKEGVARILAGEELDGEL